MHSGYLQGLQMNMQRLQFCPRRAGACWLMDHFLSQRNSFPGLNSPLILSQATLDWEISWCRTVEDEGIFRGCEGLLANGFPSTVAGQESKSGKKQAESGRGACFCQYLSVNVDLQLWVRDLHSRTAADRKQCCLHPGKMHTSSMASCWPQRVQGPACADRGDCQSNHPQPFLLQGRLRATCPYGCVSNLLFLKASSTRFPSRTKESTLVHMSLHGLHKRHRKLWKGRNRVSRVPGSTPWCSALPLTVQRPAICN